MVNIDINVNSSESAPADLVPARERSIFALGLIRFITSRSDKGKCVEDEMRVLGLMVIQDTESPCPAEKA